MRQRKKRMCLYLHAHIEMIVELLFSQSDGWGYMNIINFRVSETLAQKMAKPDLSKFLTLQIVMRHTFRQTNERNINRPFEITQNLIFYHGD